MIKLAVHAQISEKSVDELAVCIYRVVGVGIDGAARNVPTDSLQTDYSVLCY